MEQANHHTYVVPGLVDKAVADKQAEVRRDHRGEITIVHAHRHRETCNDRCVMFEQGFKPRPLNTVRVPIEVES